MRIQSFFSISCLLLIPLWPARAQLNGFEVQRRDTSRGGVFLITHHRDIPVTAFVIKQLCGGSASYIVQDPLINYGMQPTLSKNQSTEFTGPIVPENCASSITSAVFVDGTTEGEPEEIDRIVLRRKGAYRELLSLSEQLHAAIANGGDLNATLVWLKTREEALKIAPLGASEWSGRSSIVSFTRYLFQQKAMPNVPQSYLHVLPSEKGLMVTKRLTSEQAYAQAFSVRIDLWVSDLYGVLPSDPGSNGGSSHTP